MKVKKYLRTKNNNIKFRKLSLRIFPKFHTYFKLYTELKYKLHMNTNKNIVGFTEPKYFHNV